MIGPGERSGRSTSRAVRVVEAGSHTPAGTGDDPVTRGLAGGIRRSVDGPGPVTALSGDLAADCSAGSGMLEVGLFGGLRVLWRPQRAEGGGAVAGERSSWNRQARCGVDITGSLSRGSRELLAVLATHRDGVGRTALVEALWAGRRLRRPSNTVSTAVGRLRSALAAATDARPDDLLIGERGRYRLNPAFVTVDYWGFTDAVSARRRAATSADRRAACIRIVAAAGSGALACDIEAAWFETIREAARRDIVGAHMILSTDAAENNPRRALEILESAVDHDPHNEKIWQMILQLHARLGEYALIAPVLSLLERRLGEIGEKPSKDTKELARELRRRASRTMMAEKESA